MHPKSTEEHKIESDLPVFRTVCTKTFKFNNIKLDVGKIVFDPE